MTDTKREEIQRYEAHAIRMMNGVHYASLRRHDSGKSVLYSDHLRHLKLAQIAALEEEDAEIGVQYADTNYTNDARDWRLAKIAALKEELAK